MFSNYKSLFCSKKTTQYKIHQTFLTVILAVRQNLTQNLTELIMTHRVIFRAIHVIDSQIVSGH